jgi:hypothetical protein
VKGSGGEAIVVGDPTWGGIGWFRTQAVSV